ncbi:MAG: glycosyltransferase family 2 protein [Ktedonobacteraceae bacterium]
MQLTGHVTDPEAGTSASSSSDTMISIVIPVMNEQESVQLLYQRVSTQLDLLEMPYEVIYVDDGSTDKTFAELKQLYADHSEIVRVVRFRRHFGKTPALVAGFNHSRGTIIITMDGDLQDDPTEIPRFLEKLDEEYDVVSGWKSPRHDPFSKTFPSRIVNGVVSTLTGVHLHDINNGFKAYRREVIEDTHLKLYGELHRFIPVIAHWRGFRVTEIQVRYFPRQFGVSKFGVGRFARGMIDLLNVLFLIFFLRTPLRLFGLIGFWTAFLGFLIDAFVVFRKIVFHQLIQNQPLLFVGILLMICGVQFLLSGLQSELIRHYAFQPDEEYGIRQVLD